jgi:hypothetical protein
MTRDELIAEFRVMAQDTVAPYLFDLKQVAQWLAEAEVEAAIRGRLLHESQAGAICEVPVSVGDAVCPLHEAVYEITHCAFRAGGAARREPVQLVSTGWLDERVSDWRDASGTPRYAVQTDTSIRLVPAPSTDGDLLIECYRLPVRSLADSSTSKPEIHSAHHRHLVDWVLFRAYSIPDPESMDLVKASDAERAFTRYFGERPDSDLRRTTRHDAEHHNKAWV